MVAATGLRTNQTEFEFELGSHGTSDLAVVSWHAQEAISRPFELDVELAAAEGVVIDPKDVLGKDAILTIHLGDGEPRYIHGLVAELRTWDVGHGDSHSRYHARVVPALSRLGLITRSRIFQGQSVTDIVKKILDESKVEHKLSMNGSYGKRDYCVQYRESDLAFVSRLCEEEGIFFFFKHEHDRHVVVFGDSAGAYADIAGGPAELKFRPAAGLISETEGVQAITLANSVRVGAVALRDFAFKNPSLDLGTKATAKDGDATLELYDYPGEYPTATIGKALAKVRLEEQQTDVAVATGATSCRRLAAGFLFDLREHPIDSFNQKYLVREVRQVGQQPEILQHTGLPREPDQPSYRADFVAQPKDVPFRPARTTPRPFVQGPQTAVVVGPSGEEIHTDEHGRVKVRFHWDREGKNDEKASCWIRVSHASAGGAWGSMYIPRIGQEVVVAFIEGDPDRPIIVGRVYNGQNTTPYELPGSKTKSGIRTNSSPGGGGFNEITFEDAAGSELVFHQAQKDLKIEVKNDKQQHVGGKEALVVDGNRERTVGGNQSLDVGGNDGTSVGGSQTVTIGGNRNTAVGGSLSETIGSSHTETVTAAYALTVGAAAAVTVGGALAETVGAVKSETVAGAKMQQIGAAKVVSIAGSSSETVGGNRSFDIRGELTLDIKKNMKVTVKKEHRLQVAEKMITDVEKEIEVTGKSIKLEGKEEIVLKVGDSTMTIKSDGIVIKSSKVTVDASGDVVLKGSKVKLN